MATRLAPDICIIGAGSAGLSVAAAAAAFGVPVVLVEHGAMGGDCLNTGCVPSKALLAAGRRAQAIRMSGMFGIAARDPEIDFAAVQAHLRSVIAAIAPADSEARFAALGVRVIREHARFLDPATVAAGAFEIRARRFVVATGSRPSIPAIPGIEGVPVLTNETIFSIDRRPDHLVIIGGGPVGVEMAQAHRRLGCRVTLIEAGRLLAASDPESAGIVVETLRREGVEIIAPARILRIDRAAGGIALTLDAGAGPALVEGSHVLVATGRTPTIGGLDLDRAGIASGPAGIRVGPDLRTTNRRVYAIGDVAGSWQFTHVASHHAGLVVRAILFRLPIRASLRFVPRVTYTDPELAEIGRTDAGLGDQEGIRILRASFNDNDRARAEGDAAGHVKLIASRSGRLLGASIVGPQAGEMMPVLALALRKGLRVGDIAAMTFAYPTLSEAIRRAAISYYTPGLTNPVLRRILSWLRAFG